jgi:ubiquinone/menaquinone biosynthesis C-methylase UbiE
VSIPCIFYRGFIDPLLQPLRRRIVSLIPDGSSVLEAACGTGEQSLMLADKARRVVGFDYNPKMAECARRRISHYPEHSLFFLEADARSLPFVTDGEFDVATITLALHEMHIDARVPVLRELSRTAGSLLIADYASPLPHTRIGSFTRIIEWLAGRDHHAGFMSYQRTGGLDTLVQEAGLEIIDEHSALRGIVRILQCRLV